LERVVYIATLKSRKASVYSDYERILNMYVDLLSEETNAESKKSIQKEIALLINRSKNTFLPGTKYYKEIVKNFVTR
jgi:hypothetical protein